MTPLLKLLARLYPAAWRNRYGAEYDALLDDTTPRPHDAFDIIRGATTMHLTSRSFVRIILPCALIGALAAMAMSFALPKKYVSQTLISVDMNMTDRPSFDNQLAGLVQDSLASPFLISIIHKEDLYPSERTRMPMDAVVNLMRKNVELLGVHTKDGKPAFIVCFVYPDPNVAQRVDNQLVSGLMAANLRSRAASGNYDFLKEQLAMANDPAIKARIESELSQLYAAAAQSHIQSQLGETLRIEYPANLPQSPVFPKRGLFGASGLLAGLIGGLIAATIAGRRRLALTNG